VRHDTAHRGGVGDADPGPCCRGSGTRRRAAVVGAGSSRDPDTRRNGKTVHAVVLAMETTLTVSPDGSATRTVRRVERILDRDGAASATASAAYEGEASKVRTLRAWLIRPGELSGVTAGKRP